MTAAFQAQMGKATSGGGPIGAPRADDARRPGLEDEQMDCSKRTVVVGVRREFATGRDVPGLVPPLMGDGDDPTAASGALDQVDDFLASQGEQFFAEDMQ